MIQNSGPVRWLVQLTLSLLGFGLGTAKIIPSFVAVGLMITGVLVHLEMIRKAAENEKVIL